MEDSNTIRIIVVITTSFQRTNLLLENVLKSVYQQTIVPEHIYIVDDNPIEKSKKYSNEYYKIKKGISILREEILKPKFNFFKQKTDDQKISFKNFFQTTLIKNFRTKQFSKAGAKNSGAFEALKNYGSKDIFLAFLDDDNKWKKTYLEILFTKIIKNQKQEDKKIIAAVSGILKIERDKQIEFKLARKNFTKEKFFIGDSSLPGNLFINLKIFWKIGGFDESFKSNANRDFAIKLMTYKNSYTGKIVFVKDILVYHDANLNHGIKNFLENQKQDLDLFYRKYFHQFSKRIQIESLKKVKILFNYEPPEKFKNNQSEKNINSSRPIFYSKTVTQKNNEKFNLIIGVISNSAENLKALLNSFLKLYHQHKNYLNDYQFFILENGNKNKMKCVVKNFISKEKLKIKLLDNISSGRSIAENRTFLQQRIFQDGAKKFNDKNYVTWIIDDDILFQCQDEEIPNYFKYISKYANTKIDALFGQVSDTPPLPFLSTLRCQLIDFYYNLTHFVNCNPKQNFELNSYQEKYFKEQDFYYDLSNKNFQHLEYPYYENFTKEKNFEAFKIFLQKTFQLWNGENVFRKIIFNREQFGKLTNKSIFRGGNTIIFNSNLLRVPNYSPNNIRRSDFNWAIINKYIFKCNLYQAELPLKHNRKLQKISLKNNLDKFKLDIEGSIFYRLLENILSKKNWASQLDNKKQVEFYNSIKNQFLLKIKINNYRILFLIDLILEMLQNKKMWWFKIQYKKNLTNDIQNNREMLLFFKKKILEKNFKEFGNNLKIDHQFIDSVILEIKDIKQNVKR